MEWHIGVWPLLKLTLRPKINQNPNRNMLHYLTREANLMDVLQCLAAEVSCFHQSGSSSRSVAGWCPTEMFGGLMWFVTTINPEPWRTYAYSYNPWVFDGRCQNFLEIGEAVDPWKKSSQLDALTPGRPIVEHSYGRRIPREWMLFLTPKLD